MWIEICRNSANVTRCLTPLKLTIRNFFQFEGSRSLLEKCLIANCSWSRRVSSCNHSFLANYQKAFNIFPSIIQGGKNWPIFYSKLKVHQSRRLFLRDERVYDFYSNFSAESYLPTSSPFPQFRKAGVLFRAVFGNSESELLTKI